MIDPKFEDPADLEEIFSFGTLVHALVLEPHKADYRHKDISLAKQMAATFMNDEMCRNLYYIYDFKREHEYYRSNRFGVKARCKADGKSNVLSLCLEFKGLSVSTEAAFEEAIDRFDYDQAAAWYLDVTGLDRYLIVGVSKKSPKRLFKRLIDRNHKYYISGREKVNKSIQLWKQIVEP